jgi:hypothetical protein
MTLPYNVRKIQWQMEGNWIETVEGPGMHHQQVRTLFGDQPPSHRLQEFADALNMVFVTGRRAAQAEARTALGIRSWGRDLSLDT